MGALWSAALASVALFSQIPNYEQALLDARTESAIETAYEFNDELAESGIDVSVSKGVVTLSGTVANDIRKSLAEEIAFSRDGVYEVRNELQVDGAAEAGEAPARDWRQAVQDRTLAASLRARFLYHKEFQGLRIGVRVVNEVVTLSGVVASADQKERIGQIALDTRGVDDVINELTVVPREEPTRFQRFGDDVSDEWMEKRIETNILMHRSLSIRRLDVEVNNGITVLSGQVESEDERTLAVDVARSVPGVNILRNEILLPGEDPPEPLPLDAIEALEPDEPTLIVLPEPEPEMAVPGESPTIESAPIRP